MIEGAAALVAALQVDGWPMVAGLALVMAVLESTQRPQEWDIDMTRTFDQVLDEASQTEDQVELCLNGKLRREHRVLSERIAERDRQVTAAAEVDSRIGTKARKPDAADARLAELEELMREATVTFVVRALPPEEWNELWSKHPARVGADGKRDPRDHAGINSATFYHALSRVSIVEPEMTDERWARLLSKINDAQFDKLATAAWLVNRRDEDVPFSRAGSPQALSSVAN